MPSHETSIELGHAYRDTATGFEGTAISIHFYGHDVQRTTIAALDKNGAVAEQTFDSHRLEPSSTTISPLTRNGGIGFNADT